MSASASLALDAQGAPHAGEQPSVLGKAHCLYLVWPKGKQTGQIASSIVGESGAGGFGSRRSWHG
jgi:hypothetical protein